MSEPVSSHRNSAVRAWLPAVRLAMRMRGERKSSPFLAAHRETNAAEAYAFTGFYYLTSLTFLGACMLPGLAIVPLSELFAWPVLIVAHLLLLHLFVIVTGWLATALRPILSLVGIRRMSFQCATALLGLTAIAIPMAFVGGLPALTAWTWLGFCAVNLMAGLILLLVE